MYGARSTTQITENESHVVQISNTRNQNHNTRLFDGKTVAVLCGEAIHPQSTMWRVEHYEIYTVWQRHFYITPAGLVLLGLTRHTRTGLPAWRCTKYYRRITVSKVAPLIRWTTYCYPLNLSIFVDFGASCVISLSDPQNNMSDLKCLKKILLLLVRKSKVFKFLCEEEVEEEEDACF